MVFIRQKFDDLGMTYLFMIFPVIMTNDILINFVSLIIFPQLYLHVIILLYFATDN